MNNSIPLRALAPARLPELPRHDFDSLLRARGLALLLISHDLPVVSRVLEAPYLSLLLELELGLLRSLYDEYQHVFQ